MNAQRELWVLVAVSKDWRYVCGCAFVLSLDDPNAVWTEVASPAFARYSGAVVVWNDLLLLFGGIQISKGQTMSETAADAVYDTRKRAMVPFAQVMPARVRVGERSRTTALLHGNILLVRNAVRKERFCMFNASARGRCGACSLPSMKASVWRSSTQLTCPRGVGKWSGGRCHCWPR